MTAPPPVTRSWGRRAATWRAARWRAAILVALIAGAALGAGACGDPGKSAAGLVVAVDAPAGEVTGFTLRTQQGDTITFVIGTLEIDGAAFAAAHLVEHAATLQPIAVGFRARDGKNVVHRMVDAPWAAPSS